MMAALNSFLTWAVKHDLLDANPLIKLKRVKVPEPGPRGVPRDQIEALLKAIPREHLRDQLLFRLLAETGLRISEAARPLLVAQRSDRLGRHRAVVPQQLRRLALAHTLILRKIRGVANLLRA